MLTKLTVRNFKRFRDETRIEFSPITVLVGANNSGKSTVLQALSIFQYCIDVTRKKKNSVLTLGTVTIGPEAFGALPVTAPTDLWPDGKTGKPISIKAEFDNGATIAFEVKFSYNRFSITPILTGEASKILEKTTIRYVPIHSGLALREEYLLAPARADRIRELQYGSVIRNLLWDLKENDKERWRLLFSFLERLYPASKVNVAFDRDLDRFIASQYTDGNLTKSLDLVVSGTGFQQVLQILSGVLSKGSSIVLMDEPDAHLHARLQGELMRMFEELAEKNGIQFVLATHSPHLLAASPAGSLRAVIDGKAHPFATTPEQMDVLDTLGAFDRMEIIPLLKTKAVVFVENRDDRDYLEMFARKLWGEAKTKKVWEGLSFLFTYQEPLAASVNRLARQVKDLLNTESLGDLAGGRQPRFLVIGDRDYHSKATVKELCKEVEKAAKSEDFSLNLRCVIWTHNEIENYLIDPQAIETAVMSSVAEPAQQAKAKTIVKEAMKSGLEKLKEDARMRISQQLQQSDHTFRGDYTKTTLQSNKIIEEEWGDGLSLCDAKKLLSHIRQELQTSKVGGRLAESAIVEAMSAVPADVEAILKRLREHSVATLRKRKQAQTAKGSNS
jgi:predicted ATPase